MPADADDVRQILATLGDVREDIADHRGDVREQMAKLEGVLATLTEVKALEHTRLDTAISDVQHRVKNTEAAVQTYADDVALVKRRMDRMGWVGTGIALGSGLSGGSLALALSQVLGG